MAHKVPARPEVVKAKGASEGARDKEHAPPSSAHPKSDAPDVAKGGADKGNAAANKEKDKDPKEPEREAKEKEARDRERKQLRAVNLTPKRPDSGFLKTLSSDIKRNTAFIRKLKLAGYAGDTIITEFNGLNISRYVSEAVVALAEAPFKMTDIPIAVRLVSAVHQRYSEFVSELIPALLKHFAAVKPPEADAEKAMRLARKRVTGRLLVELYEAGVYTETSPLTTVMLDLSAGLQAELRDKTQEIFAHLPLLVSFLKTAADLLGIGRASDVPATPAPSPADGAILPPDVLKQMLSLADGAFDMVCRALLAEHRAVRGKERENQRMLETRGELTEAATAAYDRLRKIHEKLQLGAAGLAELLSKQLPVLPDEQQTTRIAAASVDAGARPNNNDAADGTGLWDDEDTRAFYETLPDLKLLVPAVLLGGGPAGSESGATDTKEDEDAGADDKEKKEGTSATGEENKKSSPRASASDSLEKATDDNNTEESKKEEIKKDEGKEKKDDKEKDAKEEDEGPSGKGVSQLDLILGRLAACANREAADALAVEFCYVNSKSARRRLVRALHSLLPRIQSVQIPCFARLVATLSQSVKDIGPPLVTSLEGEFFHLFHKKDQSAAASEQRQRNARFLAELCKFHVCSSNTIFHVLKACLDEFTHQNIDVACTLLEACGRFLFKQQETNFRMANILDHMMRRKASKALDARQVRLLLFLLLCHSFTPRHLLRFKDLLVENAFYLCKPPERSARVQKEQMSPLEAYVRHLLYIQLAKPTARHVLKQLRKLCWGEDEKGAETEAVVLRACVNAHRAKFSHVHLLASVVAGLSAYHDQLGVRLVDLLLERVRGGLDDHDLAHLQRRVVDVKMLGELYNYCLFESALLFDILFLLINLNPHTCQPVPERADSPTEYFRIRLVCTLLDTSGSYFDRGTSRRKLDRYIAYLQRYVLAKAIPPPVDVGYMLSDTLEALRPSLVRYANLEQANDAVRVIELEEARAAGLIVNGNAKAAATPGQQGDEDDEEESGDDSGDEDDGDDEADDRDDGNDSGSEGSDESDSEGEEGNQEDDEVQVKRANGGATREEDEEFDKELQRMMHESYEARKAEARAVKAASSDISLKFLREELPKPSAPADGNFQDFQVLLRKGSKQQTRTLSVPVSTSLAAASKAASAADLAEQQEVKRFVLEYGEREDEEQAHRQVTEVFPSTVQLQRGRGGVVKRVLHLSGGSGSRVQSSPEAAGRGVGGMSIAQRGGGSGGGHHYRGGGGGRGGGRGGPVYHPKS